MDIIPRCRRVVQASCVQKRKPTCICTARLGYQYEFVRLFDEWTLSKGHTCTRAHKSLFPLLGFTTRGERLGRGFWSGRCEVPQGGWILALLSAATLWRRLRQSRGNWDGKPSQPRTLLSRSTQGQRNSWANRVTSPSYWGLS